MGISIQRTIFFKSAYWSRSKTAMANRGSSNLYSATKNLTTSFFFVISFVIFIIIHFNQMLWLHLGLSFMLNCNFNFYCPQLPNRKMLPTYATRHSVKPVFPNQTSCLPRAHGSHEVHPPAPSARQSGWRVLPPPDSSKFNWKSCIIRYGATKVPVRYITL